MQSWRRWFRLPVVLVLTAGLALPPAAVAVAQSSEERRLDQSRAKVAGIRRQLEQAETDRTRRVRALARTERRLRVVREAVDAAEQAVKRQRAAVERARAELVDAQHQERRQRALMGRRAVELYKQGTGVPLTAILSSDTPGQALERSALVDLVTRTDRRAYEEYTNARVAVQARRDRLRAEQATLARVLRSERRLLAEVEEVRDRRAVVLAVSSERVADLQAQEQHLEEQSRQLAALSRRVGGATPPVSRSRAPAPAPAPEPALAAIAPVAGGWTMPASGPITSGFGPRWGRMHEGIDIGAPTGTSIYAARAGTVSYAGTMGGYGNIVLVDHGGGMVTAYAHQSRIRASVGQRVSAGQLVGEVGSTGNSTGPHLHFEVRVGGVARDPMGYLK